MKLLVSLVLLLVLTACGGGGGENVTPAPTPTATNAVALVVEAGPGGNVNMPYVSVTVCTPGTTSCKTIDHVMVDTGSTGLRLLASALSGVTLPAQTSGTSSTILECAQFLSFVTWGPVKLADIAIGGKRASNVPIQLVADPVYPTAPSGCSFASSVATGTSDLGANGILGVGLFTNDGQLYYNCMPTTFHGSSCRVALAASQQVQNPVSLFGSDNNGVLLQLPAVTSTGAVRVQGQLIFGIDTQPNNQLGPAKVIQTDSSGYFTTTYRGVALSSSFIDSGSNGLYFDDPTLTECGGVNTGFYCPTSTQNLTATMPLKGGGSDAVNFSIGNATTLLANPSFVYANLGGPISGPNFDWGLPFFLGRSVYTVIEGRSTSAGPGPLFAYTN